MSSSTDRLLRTHTSAHQSTLMKSGKEAFLCTGDVYRRDEIDATHFPAFHQMEGVKLFDESLVGGKRRPPQPPHHRHHQLGPFALLPSRRGPRPAHGIAPFTCVVAAAWAGEMTREEWLESEGCKLVAADLKKTLEGLCDHLFGDCEKRWIDEYFPFTEPSFELEIFYNGDWMEVLGCGVIHSGVLEKADLKHRHGWAFGLGLERLAMVLFTIPDIRLFWTDDQRFSQQFKPGQLTTFKPYSKYPPVFKDISFWIPEGFEPNDFFELGRGVAGELMEKVGLLHPCAPSRPAARPDLALISP